MFRKKRGALNAFGAVPDVEYYHGDMDYIRSCHDEWARVHPEAFSIDDITWRNLDMDLLFRRVNRGASLSGEQVLYHLLRTPAVDEAEYRSRRDLIALMEDEDTRGKAAAILNRLGCVRRAGPCAALAPGSGRGRLLICVILALLLPLSFAAAPLFGEYAMLPILCVVTVNAMAHELLKRRLAGELETVNYMAGMARAVSRFQKLGSKRLDAHFASAYDALKRLRRVLRLGVAAPAETDGNPSDLLLTVTLLDLIVFESLKRIFLRRHEDVLLLHDALGRLDAAISIASFRKTLPYWCEPALCFAPGAPRSIEAEAVVHPLLSRPVPNDLSTERSLLITGSNASGKSTYLRAAALCALMAQSLCTAPARSYRAPAFLIFTSMALSDNLIAGDSYYVAEMRAIKRIFDRLNGAVPVLCAVDEVLRGTNTVERIAASTEILAALDEAGALCLAASHDLELCELLGDRYVNMHFQERIEEGRMLFDYHILPGRTSTRNAISLLELIGMDHSITESAHARAERYLETGLWS